MKCGLCSGQAAWGKSIARETRASDVTSRSRCCQRSSPENPDRVRRLEQEARAIAALNHPHICQIHDVGPGYLVLEYIEGTPLTGPLSSAEAVRLALQIAEALHVAHQKGILHRDLKPANILVTRDGRAEVLDFGLAKVMASDRDVTRTSEGTVAGTAAYMSPEQLEGRGSTRAPTSSASASSSTRFCQARAPSAGTPLRRSCSRYCVTTPRRCERCPSSNGSFSAVSQRTRRDGIRRWARSLRRWRRPAESRL